MKYLQCNAPDGNRYESLLCKRVGGKKERKKPKAPNLLNSTWNRKKIILKIQVFVSWGLIFLCISEWNNMQFPSVVTAVITLFLFFSPTHHTPHKFSIPEAGSLLHTEERPPHRSTECCWHTRCCPSCHKVPHLMVRTEYIVQLQNTSQNTDDVCVQRSTHTRG